MSDTENDPSGNSDSSFHVAAGISNLLLLYDFFIFLYVFHIQRFDKATYLSLLFKFILSARWSNSLRGSDVLPILEFIKYSVHFCIIPLLNTLYCYILS